MKKRIEAELISIAHRILKLKGKEDTLALYNEAKNLYEQMALLRFYETNFSFVNTEISIDEIEKNLTKKNNLQTNEKENSTAEADTVNDVHAEDNLIKTDVFTESVTENITVDETAQEEKPQQISLEELLGTTYKEPEFVNVQDVPIEVEKAEKMAFEKTNNKESETIKEVTLIEYKGETQKKSLNDKLLGNINIGLNDRIAFEKKLFGGSSQDLNRVISQLNTFDTFDEAKSFINNFIKPDYDNWQGKEEFENRFLEIIEKKYS